MKKISVVIPTYNRKERLLKTIRSVMEQSYISYEIIIVDASETPIEMNEIHKNDNRFNFLIHTSIPSVCTQRNIGIKAAKGEYILLLDDDISLDQDYIEKSINFFSENSEVKIVSGLVLERDHLNEWRHIFPKKSFRSLLWAYIFQLGIWSEIKDIKGNFMTDFFLKRLKNYYLKKGNSLSNAGWPLVTSFDKPFFKTKTYGLGASLFNRNWLTNNLYEEKLERHGIGDNYGVAMGLNDKDFIYVLSNVLAYHYKEPTNRLSYIDAYSKRIEALHYFIVTKNHAPSKTVRWLLWSLTGNCLSSLFKVNLKFLLANLKLTFMILLKRNPLLKEQTNTIVT